MVQEEGDAENVSRDCILFYVLLQDGGTLKNHKTRDLQPSRELFALAQHDHGGSGVEGGIMTMYLHSAPREGVLLGP